MNSFVEAPSVAESSAPSLMMEPNITDDDSKPPQKPSEHQDEEPCVNHLPINVLGLLLVCATPMLLGFLYGYDIGATSFVLQVMLLDESSSSPSSYSSHWWSLLTSWQQGLLVSAVSLGALLVSHLLSWNHPQITILGRRMELRVAAWLYTIGTLLNVSAGSVFSHHGFPVLLLGRCLYGIGVGLVMHGAPTYLAEMCPPQIRGAVVSAKETVIVSGIVMGYAVGNWFVVATTTTSEDYHHWTFLYAVTLWLEVPLVVATYWIPRSKRWLLLQGELEEAKESMRFVYQSSSDDDENDLFHRAFDELVQQVDETMGSTSSSTTTDQPTTTIVSIYQLFRSPEHRPALVASMGLIGWQQISGQPSVLSYTTLLLQEAGWGGNASVLTSVLMMFVSLSTALIVDGVGRKPLLKTCCAVMMISCWTVALCFWFLEESESSNIITRQILLVALCGYIGGYQIGFGPVTWCLVSELFSLPQKGQAIALGVQWNYVLNFAVQLVLPIWVRQVGWKICFAVFGGLLAVAYGFVDRWVPETKGLTLEEIQYKLLSEHKNNNGGRQDDPSQLDEVPIETTRLL